jgi:hypothetical protein
MSPAEWIERIDGAIDDAVSTLSTIAPVGRPAWLGHFQFRVAAKWRETFVGMLEPEDVDRMVADIVETVQVRLAEIESVTLH